MQIFLSIKELCREVTNRMQLKYFRHSPICCISIYYIIQLGYWSLRVCFLVKQMNNCLKENCSHGRRAEFAHSTDTGSPDNLGANDISGGTLRTISLHFGRNATKTKDAPFVYYFVKLFTAVLRKSFNFNLEAIVIDLYTAWIAE